MYYSLYLHIPFCRHRCAYCDFNTYAGQEDTIADYVEALCNEIRFVGSCYDGRQSPIDLHTVFFGGGTPSLLTPAQIESILIAIRANFGLVAEPEITIEANPGTVSLEVLRELRHLGINRISFGVQSANPEELRMLEREHSFFDVISAVEWARKAGFDNLNLDLIYGLPEQQLATWQATLRSAVELRPQHLSLYALTLEHGTPFGRWAARGLLPLPDPDTAADMYEWAGSFLAAHGFEQYEISNWALDQDSGAPRELLHTPQAPTAEVEPSYACKHNLQYWRGLPYLGLGAGAHGYARSVRYSNVLRIKTYIERLRTEERSAHGLVESRSFAFPLTPAAVNQHRNTAREDMDEFMLTGLRLTRRGVSVDEFEHLFDCRFDDLYGKEVQRFVSQGLLEWKDVNPLPPGLGGATGRSLRLTRRGRLLGNQVFMTFVR
jgi:oxygen-independent coproporphyrinogen-3 oxidase